MEPRCAAWARAERVDPIGTAGSYAGFVCIEWRRPWPRDLSEAEALAPLAAEAAGKRFRLQGLLPVDPGEPGARGVPDARAHVVVYRNGEEGFGAYLRTEAVCAPGEVAAAALDLLGGAAPAPAPPATDVLVCTHGRRDICCGSRGSALLAEVGGPHALGPDVCLWATTHTGGHRFAPTAIVLPEGTMWAFLEPDLLRHIVTRQGPVTDVLPHYRGCAGLGSPALQALERAVLAEVGWDLFDCRRTGTDLGAGRVRLDVAAPDGSVRSWEATVETGRMLPVPVCGRPPSEATKSEAELVVGDLRPLSS